MIPQVVDLAIISAFARAGSMIAPQHAACGYYEVMKGESAYNICLLSKLHGNTRTWPAAMSLGARCAKA